MKHLGLLNGKKAIHVDVLKIQHHGSEHNMTEEFAKTVTADNYLLRQWFQRQSGLIVLERIFDAQIKGRPEARFQVLVQQFSE